MENLTIAATKATPSVYFNVNSGILEIKGRSIPENSIAFYDPIHNHIKNYLKNPLLNNCVNIQLDYLNSSSTASLLNILREYEKMNKTIETVVNWFYEEEDEDILTVGQNFESLVELKFNMVGVKDENEEIGS